MATGGRAVWRLHGAIPPAAVQANVNGLFQQGTARRFVSTVAGVRPSVILAIRRRRISG